MSILVESYPPFRECHFCLCLQGGSVYADFDADKEGYAILRRISFDGYGCCEGAFKQMSLDDSRKLVEAVEHGALSDPKIEKVLRSYFRDNTTRIWSDALASNDLDWKEKLKR